MVGRQDADVSTTFRMASLTDGEEEQATAGPSTTLPTMRLWVTSLRVTIYGVDCKCDGWEGSSAEVDEFDGGKRASEELGAEELEFFYGVRGVELAGGLSGAGGGDDEMLDGEMLNGLGGGLGGVDDGHGVVEVVEGGFDEGFEERVVGAAEQED